MVRNTGLLEVNEIFGPTIQGEGTAAGQHCMFVRLFGCNLECTWCDTAKTWAVTPDKAAKTVSGELFNVSDQREFVEPKHVVELLKLKWDITTRPTLIVISGGEPMMQARKLVELCKMLTDTGNRIHIETAGTIKPLLELDMYVEQYNVSPKLGHSGNMHAKRYKPEVLKAFLESGKAQFKFVVQDEEDLHEIGYIVSDVDIPSRLVQIMPEGVNDKMQVGGMKRMIRWALDNGFGLSPRMHILIWGNKSGV